MELKIQDVPVTEPSLLPLACGCPLASAAQLPNEPRSARLTERFTFSLPIHPFSSELSPVDPIFPEDA